MNAEEVNVCVISDIGVKPLAGVNVNLLSVVANAWGFLGVSALLKYS